MKKIAAKKKASVPGWKLVPKTSTVDRRATVLKALSELYLTDKTRPGIVEAYIHDKKQFYVSFVRYNEGVGLIPSMKIVLSQGYAATLEEAFDEALKVWRDGTVQARRLARLAKGIK